MTATISPTDLAACLSCGSEPMIIDVREPDEYQKNHIQGSRNVPLTQLSSVFAELQGATQVVFVCKTGARSAQAANFMNSSGLITAKSLEGGLLDWPGCG